MSINAHDTIIAQTICLEGLKGNVEGLMINPLPQELWRKANFSLSGSKKKSKKKKRKKKSSG